MNVDLIKNDLTIIGCGLAGVCAALAAAREGVKVALVTNRPVLGGNSSSEMRMWTRGATGGGNFFAEEMGILGELKLENLYRNLEGNSYFWDDLLLDFILRESNIKLFLNTQVVEVFKRDDTKIERVQGYQLGTEKEFWFESDYFLDATGDGTVGALAGAKFRKGRESRAEFGERFAPEKEDPYLLGSTIYFQTKRAKNPVRFIPPHFAYSEAEIKKILNHGGRIVNEKMSGCDYWWLEYGGILDTIGDNQQITLELKRIAMGIWNYIKNSGEFDADCLTLEWIGSLPGKRESRRLVGDYILNQNDIMESRRFEDGVAYGGWFLDFHPPEGIYSRENFCEQIPVTIYDIPMRCLYSANISNLLMAGRDISASHAAFASTRIMNTCALTGQAAGTLASFALRTQKSFPQLYQDERENIRQHLLANDQLVIGCKNNDPSDLARLAQVAASSVRPLENTLRTKDYRLEEEVFIIFPWQQGMKEFSLYLAATEPTRLSLEFYRCEHSEGFRRGPKVGEREINLSQTEGLWQALPVDFPEPGSYHLVIQANPRVSLGISEQSCTGISGGLVHHRGFFKPCFKLTPATDFYGAQNLLNGYNRPYQFPNLWISDRSKTGESEWLLLQWERPVKLREIRMFFNPDLGLELTNTHGENWAEHHGFVPRPTMPPELVKDYSIYFLVNGQWQKVRDVRENRKRMTIDRFEPVTTRQIKIEIHQTYGSPYIEVFEIRAY